jgi:hypothetical protein
MLSSLFFLGARRSKDILDYENDTNVGTLAVDGWVLVLVETRPLTVNAPKRALRGGLPHVEIRATYTQKQPT